MKIEVLTIFPEIFSGFMSSSLIGKAAEKGILSISLRNIRDYSDPPHFQVDEAPYGGGAGMVMKPAPLARAIEAAKAALPKAKVVLLSPAGEKFSQTAAQRLSEEQEVIIVCGRYEGIDQRVIDLYVDREISLGDYVLMGGETAAMVIIEASARLIADVVGNSESTVKESFQPSEAGLLLEAPQYTRPAEFGGLKVPEVLLSGNHKDIEAWRRESSLKLTKERRPDLIGNKR